ncbi:MAG: SDR family NAD(P)-dependent oxidoreductase [Bacteroidetes bacterium]|nr:SDR family NAD(P)-dependent oxidoreductase [Bacteroidota bacterium]
MKKVALITGGSSGLGFALAELLGKQGYSIIILARNQERINKAVAALVGMGISAKGISCDITSEEGLKKAFEQVKTEYGKIDYLVLNAGVVTTKLLSDYTNAAEMKQDLEIDLWGTILSAHTFLPLLVSSTKVLLISSGFGLMGAAGYSMYCAAKAGIINFGECLRRELLSKGINVYVACPGDMDTPQFHEEIKNAPQWMKKETPRKLMKTADVAVKILKQANGSKKYLIVPSGDVNLLVILSKILPRKFRDSLLDGMFPKP